MQAEHNWAPPTIGDVRLPDRDLGRRLSRQPSVEMRAKMLGLDWTTLVAARNRLRTGVWLISSAAASAAMVSDLSLPASRNGGPVLTLVVVAIAVWACMLGLRSISGFPLMIARNDPATAARYRSIASLAPRQSLLGYRARWILVRYAVTVSISVTLVTLMAQGW